MNGQVIIPAQAISALVMQNVAAQLISLQKDIDRIAADSVSHHERVRKGAGMCSALVRERLNNILRLTEMNGFFKSEVNDMHAAGESPEFIAGWKHCFHKLAQEAGRTITQVPVDREWLEGISSYAPEPGVPMAMTTMAKLGNEAKRYLGYSVRQSVPETEQVNIGELIAEINAEPVPDQRDAQIEELQLELDGIDYLKKEMSAAIGQSESRWKYISAHVICQQEALREMIPSMRTLSEFVENHGGLPVHKKASADVKRFVDQIESDWQAIVMNIANSVEQVLGDPTCYDKEAQDTVSGPRRVCRFLTYGDVLRMWQDSGKDNTVVRLFIFTRRLLDRVNYELTALNGHSYYAQKEVFLEGDDPDDPTIDTFTVDNMAEAHKLLRDGYKISALIHQDSITRMLSNEGIS